MYYLQCFSQNIYQNMEEIVFFVFSKLDLILYIIRIPISALKALSKYCREIEWIYIFPKRGSLSMKLRAIIISSERYKWGASEVIRSLWSIYLATNEAPIMR
jgi:hypothetical protein